MHHALVILGICNSTRCQVSTEIWLCLHKLWERLEVNINVIENERRWFRMNSHSSENPEMCIWSTFKWLRLKRNIFIMNLQVFIFEKWMMFRKKFIFARKKIKIGRFGRSSTERFSRIRIVFSPENERFTAGMESIPNSLRNAGQKSSDRPQTPRKRKRKKHLFVDILHPWYQARQNYWNFRMFHSTNGVIDKSFVKLRLWTLSKLRHTQQPSYNPQNDSQSITLKLTLTLILIHSSMNNEKRTHRKAKPAATMTTTMTTMQKKKKNLFQYSS